MAFSYCENITVTHASLKNKYAYAIHTIVFVFIVCFFLFLFVCLFMLVLRVPVNSVSLMPERFLVWTSSRQVENKLSLL